MKPDKVLISPTRKALILFWELLNIKFYDKYSSFSLFVFSARSRRLACLSGNPARGWDGGGDWHTDHQCCGKALAAGNPSVKHRKLAPEPSLALGASVANFL